MGLTPVGWQSIINPVCRVSTVHAQRIGIVTVDIDRRICTRCVDTARPCDVIDERYIDAQVSELLHQVIHVVGIGEGDVVETRAVLVLGLKEDDGTACAKLSVESGEHMLSHTYHS